VASDLKQMEGRIFQDGPLGLRQEMVGHEEPERVNPVPLVPAEHLKPAAYWGRSAAGARSMAAVRQGRPI
ncbi:MAG: hypothetical protein HY683_03785, partial [Chloroflexi bacterium]|nr:hypothetical protein [Chloroflexota bacterium]